MISFLLPLKLLYEDSNDFQTMTAQTNTSKKAKTKNKLSLKVKVTKLIVL